MGKRKSIIGNRYGRLTVTEFAGIAKGRQSMWKCMCDCGIEIIARGANLKRGATQSCGCLRKETIKQQFTKHGMSHTALEYVRNGMVSRCGNPNNISYHNYGGRGISVCKNWKEIPQSFYKWAEENGYAEGLTIDRIDNDGNYEPENCRWVTHKENQKNRRTNHKVTFNGETLLISEWDEKLGLRKGTISDRIHKLKWDVKKAISTPRGTRWSHRQEVTMYNLFKVKDSGYENPNIYVDTPVNIYPTETGWIVEDVVTGREMEFFNKEDAETFAANVERYYEYGDDISYEEEY